MFKQAAAEEMVPVAVHQALTTVQGLQRGRGDAREAAPVEPVPDGVVDATLPFLNRHVRGMVAFERLTGCRPGEVCPARMSDIDTTGPVWLYRPRQHKTAWRGKQRTVAVGPKAQEVLRAFATGEPDDDLFSPARAVDEFRADRAAKRKTPRYPSHVSRNARVRVRAPRRRPAGAYKVNAYGHAIARACDRAFPPPAPLGQVSGESVKAWWGRLTLTEREAVKEWQVRHRWHPNQLRHTFASRVRRDHGLEAAQVLLGHARADVTQVYAERDEKLAISVAASVG